MADEIKQTRNVGRVTPPARGREPGPRRRPPRDEERRPRDERGRQNDDGEPHRVDEYV